MSTPRPVHVGGACGAAKTGGGTCGLPAGFGTSHVGAGQCKFHAGSTRNGELAGAIALARHELVAMGRPLPIAPEAAILQCIAIGWGEVHYCDEKIAALEAEGQDLAGPVVSTVDRPLKLEKGKESETRRASETHTGPPALGIWVKARREAMRDVVAWSATAIKCNIEERKVKLAEDQAEIVAEAFRQFCKIMNLDPKAAEVRSGMRQALVLVRGGLDSDVEDAA